MNDEARRLEDGAKSLDEDADEGRGPFEVKHHTKKTPGSEHRGGDLSMAMRLPTSSLSFSQHTRAEEAIEARSTG